ncbi:MAG: outer membrane lipid asymmetry maintenance protein MlaD [Alphaproteobacteria bacterium]|jgi:phospholipid/cholesterol/gamma-HCH transport system substrate-binding protein|nr:outer membrane lipid asymmetry maintenance protein MlaD [Alphaproteobacteria bacterium]
MTRNTIETVMGAVVLLVAGVFLYLAYTATSIQSSSGTKLNAEFGSVSGLSIGDEVRISGIAVGKVIGASLNEKTFGATVTLSVDERITLPADTAARIAATSLLGGSHVELIPGFEEDYLKDGDTIYDTRDPVNLTDLLGKAIFSSGPNDG